MNKHLITQLKEFGLNPNYWCLKKLKQKNRWMIIHKKEQGVRLIGTTEKNRDWKAIEWVI
ncbi:MAG: hypothetical protein OXH36_00375 [Bdellovibrionales bacterium]|nr:hypothetical protein [Bdellovibrionales bacterium]